MRCFRACCFSLISASRSKTISSAPEVSPARTMFTYSEEKVPGYKERDWAKLFPSIIESLIFARIFLNAWDLVCGISVSSADTSGNPASTKVDSCLVIIETSCGRTRVKDDTSDTAKGAFFAVSCTSFIETGKVLDVRSFRRAERGLSASIIPETFFPFVSKAVYSYTGIFYKFDVAGIIKRIND